MSAYVLIYEDKFLSQMMKKNLSLICNNNNNNNDYKDKSNKHDNDGIT